MPRPQCLLGVLALSQTLACSGPDRAFPESASGGSGPGTGATGSTESTGSTTTTTTGVTSSGGSGPVSSSNAGGGDSTSSGGGGGGGGTTSGDAGGGAAGTGGETSTGGGSGTGGNQPTCANPTDTCVAAVPATWSGPVAVYEGSAAPGCLGDYPDSLGDLHGDLDEGSASCNCDCGGSAGIVCTGEATLCYNNNCNNICNTTSDTVPMNQCVPIVASSAMNAWVQAPPPTNMGTCPVVTNHDIDEPVWGVDAVACGGARTSAGNCGVETVCTPSPADPFQELCIVHAGEVDCPAEFWTDRRLRYEDFEDGRTCTSCSCGSATSTCGGSVSFAYNDCNFGIDSVAVGTCGAKNFDASIWAEDAGWGPSPSGTCAASSPTLSGEVTRSGSLTLCCATR